jgi:hypothetical protein
MLGTGVFKCLNIIDDNVVGIYNFYSVTVTKAPTVNHCFCKGCYFCDFQNVVKFKASQLSFNNQITKYKQHVEPLLFS